MRRPVGPGRPPVESRFRKGQSGNPKGRPKKAKPRIASAFDIVIDRTLTLTQDGKPRAVTVEEALQHRTYQEAIAGNRAARREILKMIAKREQYLAAKHARSAAPKFEVRDEPEDPDNADAALLILGIAERNPTWDGRGLDAREPLLEPWAVQAALSRRRDRQPLTDERIAEVKRCTRAADTVRWPRNTGG